MPSSKNDSHTHINDVIIRNIGGTQAVWVSVVTCVIITCYVIVILVCLWIGLPSRAPRRLPWLAAKFLILLPVRHQALACHKHSNIVTCNNMTRLNPLRSLSFAATSLGGWARGPCWRAWATSPLWRSGDLVLLFVCLLKDPHWLKTLSSLSASDPHECKKNHSLNSISANERKCTQRRNRIGNTVKIIMSMV